MTSLHPTDSTALIEARRLGKSFGDTIAVDSLSFSVDAGSILGLLGPNGAGKSTAIKMLTTLLPIESGTALVAGFDVATQPAAVRRFIGLAGQAAAIDEQLTTRENLELFGRLYKVPRLQRRQRIGALIDQFDMHRFADRPAKTYSGGERRRLDVVAALVGEPAALFLDEPTTGLDPRSRSEIWDAVRRLASEGTAIVLTTQYLEEADHLADHVLVIDNGKEVAFGTPDHLKRKLGRDVLQVRLATADDLARTLAFVSERRGVVANHEERRVEIAIGDGAGPSLELLRQLEDNRVAISDFQLRRPTLDDVFLALTEPQPAIGQRNHS